MTKSSADVEREVEATRGQIDRTVEALKEKMQPRELFDEATRMMGGTSNRLLSTAVEQARANPIPVALIGLGVAWLAFSQRRQGGSDDYTTTGYYETYEGYDETGSRGGKLKEKVSGAVDAAKGKLSTAKERISGAVTHAKDGISSAKASAADGAGTARGRVSGLTSGVQTRAGDVSRQAQQRFQDQLDTEPLILGALGLIVGAAIGASIPATRAENRMIGPHRDRIVGRGKEAAKTSLDEAKTVAQRAYGQVKGELHRQTGPDGEGTTLRDKAKALADAGVQSVREDVDSRIQH